VSSLERGVGDRAIYLGRIVKAFGIKGEVKFVASDDYWDGVLESRALALRWIAEDGVEEAPVRVKTARPHAGAMLLTLDGVDDREAAEAEVGRELFIDRARIDVPPPESVRPFQVIGSRVLLEDGEEIGRVTAMVRSAAHPVYEVTGPGGVVLIPGVPQFVVGRDEERGTMTIRPIPGLLDG
jgi:16S rRNA processing protein RimM